MNAEVRRIQTGDAAGFEAKIIHRMRSEIPNLEAGL